MKKGKKALKTNDLEKYGVQLSVIGVATYRNGKPGSYLIVEFIDIDEQLTKIMIPSNCVTEIRAIKKVLLDNRFPYDIPKEAWEAIRKELIQKTSGRMLLVESSGFYNDIYLRSDNKIIGNLSDDGCRPILDPNIKISLLPVESKGTLKEWRLNIANAALHSSRIMLSLSATFSAYILYIAGIENGGFNFFGISSTGKSTCLQISVSVRSSPAGIESWSVTETGAEELAVAHNDKTLVLDELGNLHTDPLKAAQKAGKLVYALTFGKEKRRSAYYSSGRFTWRIVYLSSGEKSLTESAIDAGVKRMLGEEVRLIDVPSDAGLAHGIYESIPQGFTASQYADHLKDNCAQYYGVAERVFLKKLTAEMSSDLESLRQQINSAIKEFLEYHSVDHANGSEMRLAKRFALAYAGGQLAAKYGVLPFDDDTVIAGVSACYRDTIARRPQTHSDLIEEATNALLNELKETTNFLDVSHVEHGKTAEDIKSASGFIATYKGNKVRAMLPATLDELISACKIRKAVLKTLKEAGRLQLDANGRSTIQLRSHLKSPKVLPRCYCFLPKSSVGDKPIS